MKQWGHAPNGALNNNRDKNEKLYPSIGRLVTHYQSLQTLKNIQHWKIGLPGRWPNVFAFFFLPENDKVNF